MFLWWDKGMSAADIHCPEHLSEIVLYPYLRGYLTCTFLILTDRYGRAGGSFYSNPSSPATPKMKLFTTVDIFASMPTSSFQVWIFTNGHRHILTDHTLAIKCGSTHPIMLQCIEIIDIIKWRKLEYKRYKGEENELNNMEGALEGKAAGGAAVG